jgi:hypothetical protein
VEFVRIILILKRELLIRIPERRLTQLKQILLHHREQHIPGQPVQQQLTLIQEIPVIPDQVHPVVAHGAVHLPVVVAEAVHHLIVVAVPLQAVRHIQEVEEVAVQEEVHAVQVQVQAPVDDNEIKLKFRKIIN